MKGRRGEAKEHVALTTLEKQFVPSLTQSNNKDAVLFIFCAILCGAGLFPHQSIVFLSLLGDIKTAWHDYYNNLLLPKYKVYNMS